MQTKQVIPSGGWDAEEWVSVIVFIIGVALITTGIPTWIKDGFSRGAIYLIGGIIACVIPFIFTVPALMKGTLKYEYPNSTETELSKSDNIQAFLFVLVFTLQIIGLGVALSSAILSWKYGWDFARYFLIYGLIGSGAPMVLFVILGSIFIK